MQSSASPYRTRRDVATRPRVSHRQSQSLAHTNHHEMRFEWDPAKDRINRAKHGVSFEDAEELLAGDANCLEIYDEDHSQTEDRFIAIGPTRLGILVVVYTEVRDDVTRIVSARKATRPEKARYEAYWRGDHG